MITLLFNLLRWMDRRKGKQYYQVSETKAKPIRKAKRTW